MTVTATDLRDRADALRLSILETHRAAGAGHLGSALSVADVLAVLFDRHFRWGSGTGGDRFVLSKGHAALGLYCALAAAGRIPAERLRTFGRDGSPLEAHPNELLEPEVHASTGSLGQGLSIGVGLALGSRLRGTGDRTYVVVGDGEANEGQVWEAARSAAALGLRELVVVLDDNGMQQDGPTPAFMPVGDLVAAWRGMGWYAVECDGHDCAALDAALADVTSSAVDAPRLVRARTTKGRGVPFLEGRVESHFPPPLDEAGLALVRYAMGRP